MIEAPRPDARRALQDRRLLAVGCLAVVLAVAALLLPHRSPSGVKRRPASVPARQEQLPSARPNASLEPELVSCNVSIRPSWA
ncbi:MAG TPA: hypothetical protein VEQ58_23575 [Polyangiaceae bacterium]|nr:hypothetical protein [Polyangiaceae bacterium]